MLSSNRIWQGRLIGIGSINLQKGFIWVFSGAMVRGSGALWDIRKAFNYEIYPQVSFAVPQVNNVDCYDRYLVRLEELRASLNIIIYCLNRIPFGEVKSVIQKLQVSRSSMKSSMESTIQHFKIMSQGILVPFGEVYTATEAPKGEFGIYIYSSSLSQQPARLKIRAPGFYHLQVVKCLTYQHLLADVVTIIGTADIVFGEVDR